MPQHCHYQTGIFIGRFQPYHLGHAHILARALEFVQVCIVVIGSAYQAASPKNPWPWVTRVEMIRRSLTPEQVSRVLFFPLRDYYDSARWAYALRTGITQLLTKNGIRVDACSIVLIGHHKDTSSAYLHWFPKWKTLMFARQNDIDATPLRNKFFAAINDGASLSKALVSLQKSVPASTMSVMQQWASGDKPINLAAEWRTIYDYRASLLEASSYPILVTVDNVIECVGHILVIERDNRPGKGCLALPGGFLNTHETIQTAVVRELREKTGLILGISAMLVGVQVFDHPDRDLRGRFITHAHHFQLPYKTLPQVAAYNNSCNARWLKRENIVTEEAHFFNDYFHILDRMCGLLPNNDI